MARSKTWTEESILEDAIKYASTDDWQMHSVSYQHAKKMGIAHSIASRATSARKNGGIKKNSVGRPARPKAVEMVERSIIDSVEWGAHGLPKYVNDHSKQTKWLYYKRRVPSVYREGIDGLPMHWNVNIGAKRSDAKDVIAAAAYAADQEFLLQCDLWDQELMKQGSDSATERIRRKVRSFAGSHSDPFIGLELKNPSGVHLYILSNPVFEGEWIKIGESEAVDRRVREFNTSAPEDFVVEFSFPLPEGKSDKDAHKALRRAAKRSKREWFLLPIQRAKQIIFEEIYQDEVAEPGPVSLGRQIVINNSVGGLRRARQLQVRRVNQ